MEKSPLRRIINHNCETTSVRELNMAKPVLWQAFHLNWARKDMQDLARRLQKSRRF